MKKNHLAILGGFLAGTVALGALFNLKRETSSVSTPRPVVAADRSRDTGLVTKDSLTDATTALPLAARFVQGVEHRYAVEYTTQSRDGENERLFDFGLKGDLGIARVPSEKDVVLRFTPSLESSKPDPENAGFSIWVRDLNTAYYLTYAQTGEFKGISGPPSAHAAHLGLVSAMAAQFQSRAFSGDQKSWLATEVDPIGIYEAKYTSTTKNSVTRNKTRYLSLHGAAVSKVLNLRSLTTFSFDDRLDLTELSSDERMTQATVLGPLSSTTSFHCRRLGSSHLATIAAIPESWTERDMPTLLASAASSAPARADRPATDVVDDITLVPEGSADSIALIDELARRLAETSVEVATVVETLKTTDNDHTAARLMAALTGSRAPESIRALTDLARNEAIGPTRRGTAVDHMTIMDQPTAESLESLRELRDDPALEEGLRAGAALGYAAAMRKADEALVPDAERVAYAEELSAKLSDSTDQAEKIQVLAAIGNAAPNTAPEIVQHSLQSERRMERASAAYALRNVQTIEAETLISTTLAQDESSLVRSRAAATLPYRTTLSEVAASKVAQQLTTEQNADVQRALIDGSQGHISTYPQLLAPIRHLAENASDEKVRELASSVVQAHSQEQDP